MKHEVALWAGAAAFFGSLLTISLVDVLNPDKIIQYVTSLAVALITGAAVYTKERLDEAKRRERSGTTLHRKER